MKKLLKIADELLGPGGCPWDQEQTFFTLQPYLLEEIHELIEAIDLVDSKKILEELGDCLYALVFIAKLGEKEGSFTFDEAIELVSEKLIRRHPHVFGSVKVNNLNDVEKNWEAIKKQEGKSNPIAQIPPTLPALARAQKVIHKLKKQKSGVIQKKISNDFGQKLWDLVVEAEKSGIDAESALRRVTREYEEKFKKNAGDGLEA